MGVPPAWGQSFELPGHSYTRRPPRLGFPGVFCPGGLDPLAAASCVLPLWFSPIVSVWTNHGSSHPRIRRRSGFQDRTLALKELDSRGQTQSMISDAQGAAPLQEATSSREVSAVTVVTWGPAGLARTPTFLLVFNVCGVCVSTGFLGLRMTASIS